jgi:quinol monooxygenase YgiN
LLNWRQNRAKKTKSPNFCVTDKAWCNKSPQQSLGPAYDLAQPPSPSSTHFADDAGRDAHLSGKVAQALMKKAPELLAEPPMIKKTDVLADRLLG